MQDGVKLEEGGHKQRFGIFLERLENLYLKVLRAAILLVASGLLLYAGWLLLAGIFMISRSADSVDVAEVRVEAKDIVSAKMPASKTSGQSTEAEATSEQRAYYQNLLKRYFDIYRTRFEPYRQADDKQLSLEQFDDQYLNTSKRLKSIAAGEVYFPDDKRLFDRMLEVMSEASTMPETIQRLEAYKAAKKVEVQRRVERTRTEYRRGWDSSSTACEDWYYSPYGCAVSRAVEVPYTETVKALEFPAGTQSHSEVFRAFHDRYFELLDRRESKALADAENSREEIRIGNIVGAANLSTALTLAGIFLGLMFFFLLIAIERHQRLIATKLED